VYESGKMWDIVGDCPLREIRVIFLYFQKNRCK
jgi:hypothetical protein